ncbi:NAD(P)-dependent oxidoreductase [Pelagibacterales bacterium SAG-MED24]|nr:NAD(P)-dependent oxidoreductase [Pelagibacterales bacterium SAG-MED22]MBD1153081.1 NAD(P)-dependent oxidoreductase [Pelagibacterales bacterium SAG-MED24]MBD1153784.1 NAD(P)-dependent oxidoreductase [Pelagibacterales bacterium SAG-MED23]MBD1155499.1 NAD(P)-dependent oxidoreductase [Pelagibacterales bacterium SAG-MED18]MBD1156485.1 NAD(P)-dependent oxidoreductase [Pelagibacterales bacterium SAG-MED16]MBD1159556.1 NAD(P)-dependent oxidoreductase [Pelagibacterales bacterium SAG-MED19]MBD116046
MMSKVLITGGAGYIGTMLSTKLLEQGHHVTVVDLLKYDKGSLNHLYFHKNFNFICEDVRNKNLIKKLVRQNDFIIPLAALVGAPLCEKFKKDAKSTNLGTIKTLCEVVTKKNKVIYLTTNSGYGVGEKNKYCDENSPLNPISLYGRTKCDGEDLVRLKIKNHVCFRLATVFGHSYRMRSDLLVNNFVYTAVKKKKLTLFEPHFRRNFIHVRDVVNAIIFTMKNFNKLKNDVYNLGLSSANISKIMLARSIQKQYKKLKIKIVKNRKDPDKRDYFVSNRKIENKGFKATISLDKGISELIQIFSNDKNKVINNY